MEYILVNANIHTLAADRPRASVLAVGGRIIAYAGDSPEEAAAALSPGAPRLDMAGRTVILGIIDSHLHILTLGQSLLEMDIFLKSKEEILRLVAEEAKARRPGEWILGRGWNHECWEDKEWPRKEELDSVAPDHPVALNRADSHSIWVNSLALEAAGIGRNTPDPAGGEILRDPGGGLRGILTDTAMYKIWMALPPLDNARTVLAYETAQAELFRHGITSVGDAWLPPREYGLLCGAYASGRLKIRCYAMLATTALEGKAAANAPASQAGLYGERLSLRAFKIVGDGSLGSRSAWLTRDYADRPGHRGNGRYTDEELAALARTGEERGFQLCVHAIGDAAVHQAIRVLGRLGADPGHERRRRIEHFQMASGDSVARALTLGILPAMQTVHALSDRGMAQSRLDKEALGLSYPWRRILDAGGIFANGSDAPMDLVNPFHGLYAAVTMRPFSGDDPERGLSREEALKSYTAWAAFAEFAEGRKGTLEAGKLADFAVLDRDIMSCPEEDIKGAKVLLTVVGGEKAHEIPGAFPA